MRESKVLRRIGVADTISCPFPKPKRKGSNQEQLCNQSLPPPAFEILIFL
jgi:hypothetical protein